MARPSEVKKLTQLIEGLYERLDMLEEKLSLTNDEVLDADQAAKHLGIKKSYLYRLTSGVAERGGMPEIPHFKRGRKLHFRKSDLAEWQTQNRVMSRSQINAMVN